VDFDSFKTKLQPAVRLTIKL